MKPQHVEGLCFIDREQRTIEFQVFDFESVRGGRGVQLLARARAGRVREASLQSRFPVPLHRLRFTLRSRH